MVIPVYSPTTTMLIGTGEVHVVRILLEIGLDVSRTL
jgi:hypothetical protein